MRKKKVKWLAVILVAAMTLSPLSVYATEEGIEKDVLLTNQLTDNDFEENIMEESFLNETPVESAGETTEIMEETPEEEITDETSTEILETPHAATPTEAQEATPSDIPDTITENQVLRQANLKAATLIWPVPGHTRLSQGHHQGSAIDISDGSINGATVVAAIGGTVTYIFKCAQTHHLSDGDCRGFGTGIVIKGDDGRTYSYAHMQGGSMPANVYRGAYISAGQKVGTVGTTGNSSGPHLHFAITANRDYWIPTGINPANEKYIYSNTEAQINWSNYAASYTDDHNAIVKGRANSNVSGSFTEAGGYVWNGSGSMVAQKSESVNHKGTYLDVWYNIVSEMGASLSPGSNYQYQLYVVFNGKRFDGPKQGFTTTGTASKEGWRAENGSTYYYRNNQKLTGWQTIGGNRYYFSKSSGNSGKMAIGFTQIGEKYYYFSGNSQRKGVMLTGLTQVGNEIYYFQSWGNNNERGARYSGWIKINGQTYYFNKSGHMLKGWNVISNNLYYFSAKSGHMYTGFCKIGTKFYYFSNAANRRGVRLTGLTQISGTYYYFDPHGITGTRRIGNANWYFENGKFQYKY